MLQICEKDKNKFISNKKILYRYKFNNSKNINMIKKKKDKIAIYSQFHTTDSVKSNMLLLPIHHQIQYGV